MNRIKNLLIYIPIIVFFSFNIYSSSQNNIRQVIVYKTRGFINPGIISRNDIILLGGELIPVIDKRTGSDKKIYLRFKRKNKNYFVMEELTSVKPMHITPRQAIDIEFELSSAPLPYNYEPPDLTEVTMFSHKINSQSRIFLRRNAAISFIRMAHDAKKDNIDISVIKGYVSIGAYSRQYFSMTNTWGGYLFYKNMEKPSYSPFHTGTYLYVSTDELRYRADDHFVFTPAYKWLLENSQFYGFHLLPFTNVVDYKPYILRYTGNTSLIFSVQKPVSYNIKHEDKSILLKFLNTKPFNVKYLVIHDNENTATKGMFYALKKYGGNGIELVNKLRYNRRKIGIRVDDQIIAIDPNRIFTDENSLQDMRFWNKGSKIETINKALLQIREIRKNLLDVINFMPKRYLLAVHSNEPNGNLSIRSFLKINLRNNYDVYINSRMSTKAFFYVLNRKDFDFFKKRSLNVVLLKKWNPQDGSLAFVAMKMKMPYITIECTEDDDKMMRILMDAVIDLVKYRNREWGK